MKMLLLDFMPKIHRRKNITFSFSTHSKECRKCLSLKDSTKNIEKTIQKTLKTVENDTRNF